MDRYRYPKDEYLIFQQAGRSISNSFTVSTARRADDPAVLLDEVHHSCTSDGKFIWRRPPFGGNTDDQGSYM